jgi:riboflavin synthase
MFTGIVEEIGSIEKVIHSDEEYILEIAAIKVLEDINIGDSIAVNGVCLTVTSFNEHIFRVQTAPITLQKSSLEAAAVGLKVNLERTLELQARLGGHLVSGHVNTTATIDYIQKMKNAFIMQLSVSETKYLVAEGSICIDGISLTVADVQNHSFTVSIIPHTWQNTNLQFKKTGDVVNLEFDIIAKYTEKLLQKNKRKIDEDFLRNNGF